MIGPKQAEVYAALKADTPFVARVDGWAFNTFTRQMDFDRPFDTGFAWAMANTVVDLFPVFKPTFAVTHSDEASFLFTRPTGGPGIGFTIPFNRVEKVDSLLASAFASRFTMWMHNMLKNQPAELEMLRTEPPAFDCRIVQFSPPDSLKQTLDYFQWRQDDSRRNFTYGWAFELMRGRRDEGGYGMSPAAAAKYLTGFNQEQQADLCRRNSLDLTKMPLWEKHGAAFYWERYTKKGHNPITNEDVVVGRRRVKEVHDVPDFRTKEGLDWLKTTIGTHWNM